MVPMVEGRQRPCVCDWVGRVGTGGRHDLGGQPRRRRLVHHSVLFFFLWSGVLLVGDMPPLDRCGQKSREDANTLGRP